MWLSTVLALALIVYSIRSIIFIYRIGIAKSNSLDNKLLQENSLNLSQEPGTSHKYDHSQRSFVNISENILSDTNPKMQIYDELKEGPQVDNNNSTSNSFPYSPRKDDTLAERNKRSEGRANLEKVTAIMPSLSYTALSPSEQHSSSEGYQATEIPNGAATHRTDEEYPFISVLVATHNESIVIERLMKSFTALTYPRDKFEIIIVDDSTDDTYQKIQHMPANFRNLKIIHRDNRAGWKGGALNIGLGALDRRASSVLVVDADNVLLANTLERFVSRFIEKQSFYNNRQVSILAIQGFPISKSNPEEEEDRVRMNLRQGNWVARAIDFRLSQRNMIEFAAKELMNLPVQITGSLFMIKADILKSIKFSNDLCEDWDLTIDLYCTRQASSSYLEMSGDNNNQISHHPDNNMFFDRGVEVSSRLKIIFDRELVSYCEAPADLAAYFRQRMRVSEGHTRGLRKKIRQIAGSKMLSLVDKIELFLNGLQYAKYISVLAIEITNAVLILSFLSGVYSSQQLINMFGVSFSLQAANLATVLLRIILGARICRPVRRYDIKDILSLLTLTAVTTPAFVIGSIRGLFCNSGTFYRTRRNLPRERGLTQPTMFSESSSRSSSPTGSTS